MLLDPDEDETAIIAAVRGLFRAEVLPRHAQHAELLDNPRKTYDALGRYSAEVLDLQRQIRTISVEAGFYNMFVPETIGGVGLGQETEFRVWEDLYRTTGANKWLGWQIVAHWVRGASPLIEAATREAKEKILPGLLSGEQTHCFAMSEPDAGSDPWMMSTRAVASGDGWRISGTKQWTSNGPYADWITVLAVTDAKLASERRGGITAFLIPSSAPGFTVQSVIGLFGEIGGDEAILHFDDVEVGPDDVVGEVDNGFAIGMALVGKGRLWQIAKAVGLARWSLEMALEYVKTRRTFGQPLAARQGITFPLAEAATEIHAAHLMGLNAAQAVDRGLPATKELAMAKALSSEASVRAVDAAIQVHGGIGFSNELGLVNCWNQVRRIRIGDGSSEMMRRSIARSLLKGDMQL